MEQWNTREEVVAGLTRLEEGHPGWERPAAYAVGVHRDGVTTFTLTNVGERLLPAVALGLVCGHTFGTATYELTPDRLDAAIAHLAPAVACTEMPHPNHHHWVALAEDVARNGGRPVAVFVAALDDPPVDDHDRAFRAAIA
ncbi:hypothetical protein [Nocardiopsis sp. MG754419]|uniref:hypothetical protein n=1 Tax=Nocardiopsis sp. MG754419 TaxID=2259865 RepID=UPI001BA58932|nr:hypothetical protein [Nocardiopsis sp. MG754419]MBR8742510.1 hypothetical protein [Nocardiopsis sp. MG754419]